MEFPHLGQNCSEATCNRLDFLPVKCDSCNKVFCASHYNYERHSCPGAYKKNVQVPICPLCGEPVPTPPGTTPDLTVNQHINNQCKSDSKKIYTNRCNAKGCKRKELIPLKCGECQLNFCLRHRHTSDHDCVKTKPTASSAVDTRSMAAIAAENRRQNRISNIFNMNPKPRELQVTSQTQPQRVSTTQVQTIQGNMTEDEALARALALSIMEEDDAANRDRLHVNAPATTANNAQRVPVGGRDGQQGNGKDKCLLS